MVNFPEYPPTQVTPEVKNWDIHEHPDVEILLKVTQSTSIRFGLIRSDKAKLITRSFTRATNEGCHKKRTSWPP